MGDRNEMILRSGRSTFTLACLPPEDYPVMTGSDLPHPFTLTAAELRTLIDRTRFAISTEETRYYLNGIYLHATTANNVPMLTRSARKPKGARAAAAATTTPTTMVPSHGVLKRG